MARPALPPFEMFHSKTERSLAGLQAGMLGGLSLLAVLAVVSTLDRRSWWSYSNLLAACFYGPRTIGAGPGWPTVAGAALQMVIAGTAGALFGAAFGNHSGRRLALFALMWGFFVFFVSEQYYRFASPAVVEYMPRSAAVIGHMIYGLCLTSISRIGAAMPALPTAGALVATHEAAPAVAILRSSGERPETAPGKMAVEDEDIVESGGERAG